MSVVLSEGLGPRGGIGGSGFSRALVYAAGGELGTDEDWRGLAGRSAAGSLCLRHKCRMSFIEDSLIRYNLTYVAIIGRRKGKEQPGAWPDMLSVWILRIPRQID